MTPRDITQLTNLARTLWPNSRALPVPPRDDAPVDQKAEFQSYVVGQIQVLGDYEAGEVANALVALARSSKFAPSNAEIVAHLRANRGQKVSWAAALSRLMAAVSAYRESMHADSPTSRVEWTEQDDGWAPVVTVDATSSWKLVAGEVVTRWVEDTGGIRAALEHAHEPTYRAQFRMWWESVSQDLERTLDTDHAERVSTLRRELPSHLQELLPTTPMPAPSLPSGD